MRSCVTIASGIVFLLLIPPATLVAIPEEGYNPLPDPQIFSAPLLLHNNYVYTWAGVEEGRKYLFFVDNGWRNITVDRTLFDDVTKQLDRQITFHIAGKRNVTEAFGTMDTLSIGSARFRNPPLRLSDQLQRLSRGLGKRIHGVVGHGAMADRLTRFDFQNREMRFLPATPVVRNYIASLPGMVSLPFGSHPFSSASKQIFSIPLTINGTKVQAIVDMGFNGGILTTMRPDEFNNEVSPRSSSFDISIAGYNGSGRSTRGSTVAFGSFSLEDIHTVYMNAPDAPTFVIVGVDFLKRLDVTFDFQAQTLYLRPSV